MPPDRSPDAELEVAVIRYAQLKAAARTMRTTDPDYPSMFAAFRQAHNSLGSLLSRRGGPYDAPDGLRYCWSKIEDSLVVSPTPPSVTTPQKHAKGWINPRAGKKRPRILHY